jgi:Cu-Zn family superoxide dismutase
VNGAAPALEGDADCELVDSRATLRDAAGTVIGEATFSSDCERTLVSIRAELPDQPATIHGIHVHANDKPENGEGCIADPTQPATTHFVSVDGHYSPGGGSHGHHTGDLPAVFFDHEGRAWLQFATDAFDAGELKGRAVILHAGADNYGNVPVGDAANQYQPNDPAATELTASTGNAGARIACGVIE